MLPQGRPAGAERGCVSTSTQTSLAALATADAGLDLVAYEMTRLAEAAGAVLTPVTR